MVENILESLIHFDSRGLRTIGMLFVPGGLTQSYLAGHRVAFVPPVRLYIFISALFFLLLAGSGIAILQLGTDTRSVAETLSDGKQSDPDLDKRLDSAGLRNGRVFDVRFLEKLRPGDAQPVQRPLPVVVFDRASDDENGWRDRVSAGFARATADPARFNRALEDLLPKVMFVLVPAFGLILALLYLRRRRYLAEHLVFALHLHAFLFLLFALLIALAWIGLPIQVPDLLAGLAGLYLLLALRRVYRQGWAATVLKTALLTGLYGLVFCAALVAAILVSLGQI